MQNRSNDNLPAFFIRQDTFPYKELRKPHIAPLEIYDFTFLHFHDFLEIGCCVEGKGICRVEDKEYAFQKGDVQIIFPFQKHLSKNLENEHSQWYWLNINPYILMEKTSLTTLSKIEHLMFKEMGLCGIFSQEEHPEIAKLVKALLHETLECSVAIPLHLEFCASYVYQILICLARLSYDLPKLEIRRDKTMTVLSPALDMITNGINTGSIPSVQTLADSCGMSISNFRKVWSKVIGLAPKDYITKQFLYKAQQLLLTTDRKITEIATETGFQDISGFNRQFLAKSGMSPSEFRKMYKKSSP